MCVYCRRPRYGRWAAAAVPLGALTFGLPRGSAQVPLLMAAVGFGAMVFVVGTVALGSAFARGQARRRACLRTLQTLLRLVPWYAAQPSWRPPSPSAAEKRPSVDRSASRTDDVP